MDFQLWNADIYFKWYRDEFVRSSASILNVILLLFVSNTTSITYNTMMLSLYLKGSRKQMLLTFHRNAVGIYIKRNTCI